jgi:hypothetical protein
MISICLISCEKEYLPIDVVEEEQSFDTIVATIGEDVSLLNILWIKPNNYILGAKIEIKDKNNQIVFTQLSIIESDSIFRCYPNIELQPDEYRFSLISPTGNLISTQLFNISNAFEQDEFILPSTESTFYLQMKWMKV